MSRDDAPITQEIAVPAEALAARAPHGEKQPYLVVLAGLELGTTWAITAELLIGRGTDASVVLTGAAVSRRHARVWREGDQLWIEDLGSNNGTFVNGSRVGRSPLHDGDRIEIGSTSVLRVSYQDELEAGYHERLRESALRDPLTGLYNRRALDDRIPAEIAFARRHSTPLAVCMFDIDHFKRVNDDHGHPAGDAVLRAVSAQIARTVRVEDFVVRYGGEEILVLSRGITLEQAKILAERVRHAVESLEIDAGAARLRVTLSGGVAVGPRDGDPRGEALIARADQGLYAAKAAGRNRVVVAR